MIDPFIDEDGLYRIATTPGVLGAKVLTEIAEHPNAYPELRQWALSQMQEGAPQFPPPAPPEESARKKSRKAKPPRAAGSRPAWLIPAAIGGVVLLAVAGTATVIALNQGKSQPNEAGGTQQQNASAEASAQPNDSQSNGNGAANPGEASSAPAQTLRAHGEGFSCEASGNEIICSGSNTAGDLGLDPVKQTSGTNTIKLDGTVIDLVAGGRFACATDGNGVTCWGNNDWKQTAQKPGSSTAPAPVEALKDKKVQHLWAGEGHACAATEEEVWCWGSNNVAQGGTGLPSDPLDPAQVPFPVKGKFTDLYGSRFTTCAVIEGQETPWCWGSNLGGIIDPSNKAEQLSPTPQKL